MVPAVQQSPTVHGANRRHTHMTARRMPKILTLPPTGWSYNDPTPMATKQNYQTNYITVIYWSSLWELLVIEDDTRSHWCAGILESTPGARGEGRREHDPSKRQQRSVCCGRMKGTHLIRALQVCFVFSTGDKRSDRRNPTRAFFAHGNRVRETAMWLKSPAHPLRRARTCGIVRRIVTKTIARVNISLSRHLPPLCCAIAATITPIHPSVCHSLANNTRRWLHTLPPAPWPPWTPAFRALSINSIPWRQFLNFNNINPTRGRLTL